MRVDKKNSGLYSLQFSQDTLFLKKNPHFNFAKKNWVEINFLYKSRAWWEDLLLEIDIRIKVMHKEMLDNTNK